MMVENKMPWTTMRWSLSPLATSGTEIPGKAAEGRFGHETQDEGGLVSRTITQACLRETHRARELRGAIVYSGSAGNAAGANLPKALRLSLETEDV